jgi:putative tricarboxylic transport membrane protein
MSTGPLVKGGRPDGAAFVIALGLACLGGVLIWDSTQIPDMGGYAGVGADGMPRIVGWGLVLLAIWTAVDGLRSTGETRDKIELAPVLWIIGGLALQIGLLRPLGFSVASGLLFACTAFAFGKRNLALTLPIGLVFALFVYGVFDRVLQLNLPAGLLETLLFGG